MKWFDKWFYKQCKKAWDNKDRFEQETTYQSIKELKMATAGMAIPSVLSKGAPEGEDRISFELSSAVGGRILNVRRYDHRTERNDQTTYVIASGEDVGARVAKILNLELIK